MSECPDIHSRLLRNNKVRKSLAIAEKGGEAYLVGGYIRDRLCHPSLIGHRRFDLDIAMSGDINRAALEMKRVFGGTVVNLSGEGMIRLALRSGSTIDLSPIEVADISKDIDRRDFTINSLVWSRRTGLIDRHGSIDDIASGVIRSLSEKNLKEDPLRLLRAYRFSAQYDWKIDEKTRGQIRKNSGLLKTVAFERITLEFFRLLGARHALDALESALEDNILDTILSLSFNEIQRNLKALQTMSAKPYKIPQRNSFKFYSQGLSSQGLCVLMALANGIEHIDNMTILPSRDVMFYLNRCSPAWAALESFMELDRRDQFNVLRKMGRALVPVSLIAGNKQIIRLFRKFERIDSSPPVCAEEIMLMAGIGPGPLVGKLLEDIKREAFAGNISSRREAEDYINERFKSNQPGG